MNVTLTVRVFDHPMLIVRELPGVPREGDYVELADDWAAHIVQSVTWCANGEVVVSLGLLNRDDSDEAVETRRELRKCGWTS